MSRKKLALWAAGVAITGADAFLYSTLRPSGPAYGGILTAANSMAVLAIPVALYTVSTQYGVFL